MWGSSIIPATQWKRQRELEEHKEEKRDVNLASPGAASVLVAANIWTELLSAAQEWRHASFTFNFRPSVRTIATILSVFLCYCVLRRRRSAQHYHLTPARLTIPFHECSANASPLALTLAPVVSFFLATLASKVVSAAAGRALAPALRPPTRPAGVSAHVTRDGCA